ncbi:acyltransferase domain-containing protein [Streptomyces xanthophaeus]|uniref:acyltransferase domain-containing protein n=1 Tax=Streptomyces xanthophaeus TaxID=67385 RepID=UPI00264908C0|nr:acyltransferase domain-containing protein [Streptomyces xanthophaeus]WKD32280.1 acyltransferase domain-containing protein [Streptomyces xanthophaeus]
MTAQPPPVVLLFPGQGAQQPGMAAGLYGAHAGFRRAMDRVLGCWEEHGHFLRDHWLAGRPGADTDALQYAQPLLFSVGWALGRTVMDAGVRPAALLGHSVGEVVAATLAGVFTLPDAVAVMAGRITSLAGAPAGGMLAVAASVEEVAPYTDADVVVGAVNGPRQLLLAGPEKGLRAAEERLRADGFTCRRARALTPFHSPVLREAALTALPQLAGLPLRTPTLPLYSAYTGALLTDREARDPRFWALQPAEPVLFGPALDALLGGRDLLLAEAGPGQGLTTLARRHPGVVRGGSVVVPLLPARAGTGSAEADGLHAALVRLGPGAAVPGPGSGSGSATMPAARSRASRPGLQSGSPDSGSGTGAPVLTDGK